jgi:hypothetical protein
MTLSHCRTHIRCVASGQRICSRRDAPCGPRDSWVSPCGGFDIMGLSPLGSGSGGTWIWRVRLSPLGFTSFCGVGLVSMVGCEGRVGGVCISLWGKVRVWSRGFGLVFSAVCMQGVWFGVLVGDRFGYHGLIGGFIRVFVGHCVRRGEVGFQYFLAMYILF